ncbi:MAG: glutamate--tRNA ligase family protein, partial [Pseudomonadota bacterium]
HGIEFDDLVRGKQSFKSEEIGDFIIRRADGTTAFFFCNAVDDALMGVTQVLRGEDHLTNTPRQLLILDALGMEKPQYGHISLIVGHDGSPLSKRHGSRSIRELREQGYLPDAVTNYLARLGHHYENEAYMDIDQLAANFDVTHLGRSPARYDAHQLLHWQHQALARASLSDVWEWMGNAVHDLVPEDQRADFIEAIRPNIGFPEHALRWAHIVYSDPLLLNDQAREIVAGAGKHFFTYALQSIGGHAQDFKAFSKAVGQLSGVKGKELFLPLRVALTGESGGPEMARLMPLMGEERIRARLEACLVD